MITIEFKGFYIFMHNGHIGYSLEEIPKDDFSSEILLKRYNPDLLTEEITLALNEETEQVLNEIEIVCQKENCTLNDFLNTFLEIIIKKPQLFDFNSKSPSS